ncbi:MAG TPA: ribosome-associated translation inhibitor RaiA [Solirubrobacteraceae bacterium]|nr:ribosome-associated translation inhibitor RaiA [Solirubrobacteraceae bacterium]
MRIDVKGRNLSVSDDIRAHVEKRFRTVSRQVSELAELEVELFVERNPANPDCYVAETTLHLKGVTLRAKDASPELKHSINLCSEELARQVKRHRVKRRKRREARSVALGGAVATSEAIEADEASEASAASVPDAA